MKRLAVIALALSVSAPSWADSRKPAKGISLPRGCRDRGCVRERAVGVGTVLPPFEFAPLNGAGMGSACACAAITSNRGDAVTLSRSSAAMCTIGNESTGIDNGDVVSCPSNTPRVMQGGDGSGALGLKVEPQRTQQLCTTNDFTGACWTPENVVTPAPTITNNFATSPLGTTTAGRVQLPATSASEDSGLRQDVTGLSGTGSASIYFRVNSGTCASGVDFCTFDGAWQCSTIAVTSASWTRPKLENRSVSTYFLFGHVGFRSGVAHNNTCDLLVWGPQMELGTTTTSYIVNTGGSATTATRQADSATLTTSTVGSQLDVTVVYVAPSANVATEAPFSLDFSGSDSKLQGFFDAANHLTCRFRYTGSNTDKTTSATITASAANTFRCYRTDAAYAACIGASCSSTSGQLLVESGALTLRIGTGSGGLGPVNGVIKQLAITSAPGAKTGWVGDSISTSTYGTAASVTYAASTKRVVNNWAVDGATVVSGVINQWNTNATALNTRMVFEGGVNDIRAGTSAASLAATVQPFLLSVQASGRTVIFNNIAPWKNGPSWDAAKQVQTEAYNDAMATWCSSNPSIICVDFYALMGDPGDGEALNPSYNSGDNLHPNTTGLNAWAAQLASVAP